MKLEACSVPGLLRISPRKFGDARGQFWESWQQQKFNDAGINEHFVQDNVSRSAKGVLRGLHAQNPKAQGKLVEVLQGAVFDVAVDIRKQSPSFGKWHGEILSAENGYQLWIPPGFAHGFMALADDTIFTYKCTAPYAPDAEFSVSWADPQIAIAWPEGEKIISPKDLNAPPLLGIAVEKLMF